MTIRLTVLRGLCLLPLTASAGGPVWSDRSASGTKAVRGCGWNGSNVRNLFAGAVDPRGVALDTETDRVYYADRMSGGSLGVINSVPLAGGNAQQHLSGLNRPADLRLDSAGRTLYWCEENGGTIRKALLPELGGPFSAQTVFSGLAAPYYLDVDTTGQKVFWGTSGNSLFSGPLTGGAADAALYTSGQNMRGVCVDAAAGMIYWVERDGPRSIRRRAISGGSVQDLYTGLDTPHGLVLDLSARKLYWVDTGTQNAGGFNPRGVSRGEMDGSTAGAAEVVVPGTAANQPWDIDLDLRVSTYQEWVSRYFRYDDPPSRTAKTADPDGDGQNNFAEYAFGTPPLSGVGTASRFSWFPEVGRVSPGISFRQRKTATDLEYVVEVSFDEGIGWLDEGQGAFLSRNPPGPEDPEGVSWAGTQFYPEGDLPKAAMLRVRVSEVVPL